MQSERRSFFSKLAAFFAAGGAMAAAKTPEPEGGVWLVDPRYVNLEELADIKVVPNIPEGALLVPYLAPILDGAPTFPPMMRVPDLSRVEAEALLKVRDETERLEVALAGVSAAAHGATGALNTADRDDWAWHPAYQDTLDLRRKFDAALMVIRQRIPEGERIVFWPCGSVGYGQPPEGTKCCNPQCEPCRTGAASVVSGGFMLTATIAYGSPSEALAAFMKEGTV